MATGYGKSLCFQYPSVFTQGTTFVISPLISLMEDQVLALSAANIKACFLGTAQRDSANVIAKIKQKFYRVVYITPEFAESASGLLKEVHQSIGIDLLAIDEAHCVSQWGHDFRSSYRGLGNLRNILPDVPMLAVTATATPQVVKDISRSLHLRNPLFTCTGFDRPNLFLSVKLKSGDILKDLRSLMACKSGKQQFEGPTIIYCPTKKGAEEVLSFVKRAGIKCGLYHAGISLEARKDTHRKFINDEIQVVVATVAFGMGIDKPDVRQIIHYGAPKDIESYYQEIGRAGRDGLPSACQVFYSRSDFATSRYFLSQIADKRFLEHKQNMLTKMEQYLCISSCRRRCIVSHFEGKDLDGIGGSQKCCDNCYKRLTQGDSATAADAKSNYGKDAWQLLKAVEVTGERFGILVPVYLLRGSHSQRLPNQYQKHALFAKGKERSEKWWKAFGHQLTTMGYLKNVPIQGSFGCTVELTTTARRWLASNKPDDPQLMLTPSDELCQLDAPRVEVSVIGTVPKILPAVPTNIWQSSRETEAAAAATRQQAVDPKEEALRGTLYSKLVALRNNMSHERGIPAYIMLSNKSLVDMSKVRPTTINSLLKVEDIPVEKAQRYGSEFLQFMTKFCEENGCESDITPEDVQVAARMDAKMEVAFLSLTDTIKSTYQMFEQQKMSLDQVSSMRGLKPSTLYGHLSKAIEVGLPVDVERAGLTEKIRQLITKTIRAPPINSDISRLTPIKEQLPDHIDFGMIKLTLAILQRQYGLTGDGSTLDSEQNDNNNAPAASQSITKSQVSQGDSSVSQSQSTSGAKRKLPSWMTSSQSSQKPKLAKKKNSFLKV